MIDIDDNDSVHHPYEGCKVVNIPKAMNDHDDSTDSDNNIHDDNTDYHDIFHIHMDYHSLPQRFLIAGSEIAEFIFFSIPSIM
jgi:hypothetical protein